jgi:predicted LPLAT superfamily acyltransferase
MHLNKFSKAAHLAFSRGILQRDQINFLIKVNDEAKVRRSANRGVLVNAKVIGDSELREARAKRAEKVAIKKAKGKAKRSRKRKALLRVAEEEEQEG